MSALELALLIVAFILFVVDATGKVGRSLLAIGLAAWVLAEILGRWPT